MTAEEEHLETVTQWTCEVCGSCSLGRREALNHLVNSEDDDHAIEVLIEAPEWGEGRGKCGLCSHESTLSGLESHCRDKYNHPSDLPICSLESDAMVEDKLPLSAQTVKYCPLCERTASDEQAIVPHECVTYQSAAERVRSLARDDGEDQDQSANRGQPLDHPDIVANRLLEREEQAVRVYLTNGEMEIPTEPYHRGIATTTVSVVSFDAVVERISNEDGGMSLMGRLHLPEIEWKRLGLQKHWDTDNADTVGKERYLEIWASREQNHNQAGYENSQYQLPAEIDDQAPSVLV